MDLGGDLTITTSLNSLVSSHSKPLSLSPQRSVALAVHQLNFSLQQIESITGGHSQSECRLVDPSGYGYKYETPAYLRLR